MTIYLKAAYIINIVPDVFAQHLRKLLAQKLRSYGVKNKIPKDNTYNI